jgi:hypothetical protein
MQSRKNIDSISPATMICSMVGFTIGLAGMALLGFGSLCFMKILIDSVLLVIPSVVNEKNPLQDLASGIQLQSILFHFIFIAIGTILRKLSGLMCSPDTLEKIDGFFYKKSE